MDLIKRKYDSSTQIFNLDGKVALITGGGGGGIGKSIALGMAGAGAKVVILDMDEKAAKTVSDEMNSQGFDSMAVTADVTNKTDLEKVLSNVLEKYGTLDILVNNAAIVKRYNAEDFPYEEWKKIIDVNLNGVFLCCQVFGKHMLSQKKGSIVNIASTGGIVAFPGSAAYCASKGGVIQLTRTLGVEWIKKGVRVNAIAPHTFEGTPLLNKCREMDPDYDSKLKSTLPIGRFGNLDEIIGPALFLASEASSMVTGHTLPVDGGYVSV